MLATNKNNDLEKFKLLKKIFWICRISIYFLLFFIPAMTTINIIAIPDTEIAKLSFMASWVLFLVLYTLFIPLLLLNKITKKYKKTNWTDDAINVKENSLKDEIKNNKWLNRKVEVNLYLYLKDYEPLKHEFAINKGKIKEQIKNDQ